MATVISLALSSLALVVSAAALGLTWRRYRTVDYPDLTIGPPTLVLPADPHNAAYQVHVNWLHGELAAQDAVVIVRIQQDHFFLAHLGDLGKGQFPLQLPVDVGHSDKGACAQLGFPNRPFLSAAFTPRSPVDGDSVAGIRWRCGGRLHWWGRLIEASGPGGGWRFVSDPFRSPWRWWLPWHP